MGNKVKTILLAIVTTVFIALGQIIFKVASRTFAFSLEGFFLNYYMWLGFFIYALGLLALTASLREGELIMVYPVLSLSYVWVIIASILLFSEAFTATKILGTVIIIAGVAVLGMSKPASKKVRSHG